MNRPPFRRNALPSLLGFFLVFPLFFPIGSALGAHKKKVSQVEGKRLRILREWDGNLLTVNKGLGKNRPPYLKVFRDREGLLFQIREFEKIRNRNTHARLAKLSKELLQVNFSRNMMIGIFSLPTDNYTITVKRVMSAGDRIEVNLAYKHEERSYSILPNLKIHYRILAVRKADLPVLLKTKARGRKGKKAPPGNRLQTISGKLKRWENVKDSMGLERRIKGKEHLYYIRDPKWIEKLIPFLGKRIRVKGYILKEPGSIYESEIRISEILKTPRLHPEKR